MKKKELIFKPKSKGLFKKSPSYAVAMFGKSLVLSVRYLWDTYKGLLNTKLTDYYIGRFWKAHFESSHTRLYVTGRDLTKVDESYVFMSNHESWMDIPAMFGAVPSSLRMVSKIGLTQLPLLGRAMANAGFIAVDRKNRSKAIKQLEAAKDRLEQGVSIWIAPEGTRTRSGEIGRFKKGGFHLAKQLNKSIVPVFIEGAAAVMAPDSPMVYANNSITVHFCEPVPLAEVQSLESNDLLEMVRSRIVEKRLSCQKNQN